MVRLVNSIWSRAHKFLGAYVHAPRHNMRLPLYVSLIESKKSSTKTSTSSTMSGYLRDISKTGISLVVPSLRFGNRCLISGHYPLRVAVQLPSGIANIQVAPVRYDRLKEESLERSYVIGARIIQIAEPDRKHLIQYIQKVREGQAASFSFVRDAESV
jgi:c-di-GMP-binding flagellar brake protein YcgR